MLVKAAQALVKTNGRYSEAREIVKDEKVAAYLGKALVSGSTSMGNPLVTTDIVAREFAEYAFSLSIPGRIMANAMQLPFKSQVGSVSGIGAGWVKEAQAVPVTKGQVVKSGVLSPFKVASLVVLSDELVSLSTPGTESVIRNMMVSEAVRKIDQKFLSADAEVEDLSPAGAFLNAPSAGDLSAAIDLHISNGNSVSGSALVMPLTSVLSLTIDQLRQFDLLGISVMPSQYAKGLSLIDPANMIINVEGAGLMTTREGTVEMSDAPVNNTSQPTHSEQVSLYQANAAAIMSIIYCAWVNVGKPVTIIEQTS
ncbi:phage major capsid protein [Enterobacter sp. CCUG 70166]|uniref:phage major capsid protein n=1 Tax=Enterobacter sp. CCUG 70166 TaxID=2028297 RepID=UPI001CDC0FD2|nr:phage major capsid protein [Enterobacter sp. CCUG 70166]MCA2402605.1 phage major capsid protein [Enterobacter sp. CCUG 70166]